VAPITTAVRRCFRGWLRRANGRRRGRLDHWTLASTADERGDREEP
jgi:hypothetical protein